MPDERIPSPPVRPDLDVRSCSSGFILDVEALLSSDLWALASPQEFRAAFALWCRAWMQIPAASLPNSDSILASFCGVDLRKFSRMKQMALRGFVLCNDGRLYHPRLADDANRLASKREASKIRGKAGATARWARELEGMKSCQSGMDQACAKHAPSNAWSIDQASKSDRPSIAQASPKHRPSNAKAMLENGPIPMPMPIPVPVPTPIDNTTSKEREDSLSDEDLFFGKPPARRDQPPPVAPADAELAKATAGLPDRLRSFWTELAMEVGGDMANRCLEAARAQCGRAPTEKQMVQVWQSAVRLRATELPPDQWPDFVQQLTQAKRREKDPGYVAPIAGDEPPY